MSILTHQITLVVLLLKTSRFVSEGSGHHKHISSGIQEMDGLCFKQIEQLFSSSKTCSCSYLFTARIRIHHSFSSVDTAFYAIKWAHEIAGMVSLTDNQEVSRVREAAREF